MASKKPGRMADKEKIRKMIAELHMRQLLLLQEKMDEGYLEPQEQRLIWDMVKAHNIGIDTVEDMVDEAKSDLDDRIASMATLNDEWTFD